MENNVIENLARSDNPTIAILAFLVLVLAGVVIYQWRFTQTNTVPKWIFDLLIAKVETILKNVSDLTIVINERLKRSSGDNKES